MAYEPREQADEREIARANPRTVPFLAPMARYRWRVTSAFASSRHRVIASLLHRAIALFASLPRSFGIMHEKRRNAASTRGATSFSIQSKERAGPLPSLSPLHAVVLEHASSAAWIDRAYVQRAHGGHVRGADGVDPRQGGHRGHWGSGPTIRAGVCAGVVLARARGRARSYDRTRRIIPIVGYPSLFPNIDT